jgi:FkbM family methyltransferase
MPDFYYTNLKNLPKNVLPYFNFKDKIRFINFCIAVFFINRLKLRINRIETFKYKNQNLYISYNIGDLVSFFEIFNLKVYDEVFKIKITKNIKPLIFIDLGANIGFNYIYYNNLNLLKKYIAVEPLPRNLKLLEMNMSSDISQVIPKAIWDKYEIVYLTESYSYDANSISKEGTVSVETTTLDEIFKNLENDKEEIFLKMDIEGAEYCVLQKNLDLIKNKVTYLAVEFHDIKNNNYEKYIKEISKNFVTKIDIKEGHNFSILYGVNKNFINN